MQQLHAQQQQDTVASQSNLISTNDQDQVSSQTVSDAMSSQSSHVDALQADVASMRSDLGVDVN